MATTVWTDDLVIDDSQIDFQHRQLIDSIGDLEDALTANDARRIGEALPFLRMYAQVHFADEERALALIKWPHLTEHCALHATFRARLNELESTVGRNDQAAGLSLLTFLGSWLRDHIRGADRQFAAEIRALRTRR